MTWTAPMTAVANTLLTSAQFNVHVRDNLLETEAARALHPGWIWVSDGPNRSAEREIKSHSVDSSQTTTQTEYVDLATVGPRVTTTLNHFVMVMTNCRIENSGTASSAASYTIFSATSAIDYESEAIDARAIIRDGGGAGAPYRMGCCQVKELENNPGLGSYTIQIKYRVSNNATTGTFEWRRLQTMAL